MKILKKILGEVVGRIPVIGGLVQDLITGVDEGIANLPPAERAALEKSLRQIQLEEFKAELADSADVRKLAMAELQADGLVKYVRPGILAGLFLIVVFWVVVAPILSSFGLNIPPPNMSAVPEELWWLFGTSYVGWGAFRSFDKKKKLDAGL